MGFSTMASSSDAGPSSLPPVAASSPATDSGRGVPSAASPDSQGPGTPVGQCLQLLSSTDAPPAANKRRRRRVAYSADQRMSASPLVSCLMAITYLQTNRAGGVREFHDLMAHAEYMAPP